MVHEHETVGLALQQMRELTDNYRRPPTAVHHSRPSTTALRLETDLHRHIHKENNILFPRGRARIRIVASQVREKGCH